MDVSHGLYPARNFCREVGYAPYGTPIAPYALDIGERYSINDLSSRENRNEL